MKYRVSHTHLNPNFSKKRDEPVFIVIEGAKENCAECQKPRKGKKSKRSE